MSDRFRFNQNAYRVAAGESQELLFCQVTQATSLLARQDLHMLQACADFAALRDHAHRYCMATGLGPMHIAAVQQKLAAFAEGGMLMSESGLKERCLRGTANGTNSKIEFLGILTRNRPQSLRHCLESYVHCAKQFDRTITFVVADQSDRQHRDLNIEVMEKVAADYKVEIWHIDTEMAEQLTGELSRQSGLPESLVGFAITNQIGAPFGGGANRNLLILASVGSSVLQSDDDAVCSVLQVPETKPGLSFSSQPDPTDCWFPSAEEADQLVERAVFEDVFAVHEQLLGKTLAQCVKDHDGQFSIDEARASFFVRMDDSENRILVTNAGVAGESGQGERQPFMCYEGAKRERLVKSPEHFRYVQQHQRLMRGVSQPTITEGSLCFGFNLALANDALVPPFMPVMRGEDTIFPALFRYVWRGAYFGLVDRLLYHSGQTKQRSMSTEKREIVHPALSEYIAMMLFSYHARALETDTSQRLRAAGHFLTEIAQSPTPEFEKIVRSLWWQIAGSQIAKMEGALKTYSAQPDFWAKEVRGLLSAYRDNLTNPGFVRAYDIGQSFGEERALSLEQQLVGQFGELLQGWEQLRVAALSVRNRRGVFGKRIKPA